MTDPTTSIYGDPVAPNLAIDIYPDNQPGTFLVDVSEVDGLDLLGWGMDGWVNIVCDVTEVRVSRGATRLQGALTRTEAGSATVALEDVGRRFDPMVNADAVHPGSPVRVRAWGYLLDGSPWSEVLFTGRIGADMDVTYHRDSAPTVQFTATDVVGVLARYKAMGRPDPGVGGGDDLLERMYRVAAEVGLDEAVVASDSDAAYVATLAPTALADGWGDLTAAADAELGRLWVTAADEIIARARGSELTGPVRGTLSDVHGETVADTPHCCYTDPLVRFGTDTLTNRAVAARRVPRPADGTTPPDSVLVQVDDTYSQARWTDRVPATHEDRSLELETDGQVQPWAEWLVLTSSEPELRVDSVTPRPGDSLDAWAALCATDIGDRWHFRLNPSVGPQVARTVGVLGISHDITPDGWETTWTLVDAPTPGEDNPSGWFVVGLSYLDEEDVLAPIGGTVPA